MKFLLDTHTFLWWNTEDPQLSATTKAIIADGQNEVFLSAATVWEIAIKTGKGRLILPEAPLAYVSSRMSLYRFKALPVQIPHAARVYDLPRHHDDPFDRLLVAQCQVEGLPLVSRGEAIRKYEVEVIW
jgi:PIN domain nuclease of toxin-antitoxin system